MWVHCSSSALLDSVVYCDDVGGDLHRPQIAASNALSNTKSRNMSQIRRSFLLSVP